MLLLQVRTRFCALSLGSLREVMRPLPVSPLPDMPDFVVGVARVRGRPVPVADTGRLIGLPDNPAFSRYVTLATGDDELVALAVESVIGVRSIESSMLSGLPPLLRDASHDVIAALGTLDAELLSLLRVGRSVTDQMLEALRPGAAS
jgi:purine-binding chemotaxis protein CheW